MVRGQSQNPSIAPDTTVTYTCRVCLYFAVHSSNSLGLISINSLSALYTSPWIVLTTVHIKLKRISHKIHSLAHSLTRLPVPVRLGICVQCIEYNRQDDGGILANQVDDILVVPVVQCAFGHLKVWASNASGNALEEWYLDLDELCRLDNVQDLLELSEVQNRRGIIAKCKVSRNLRHQPTSFKNMTSFGLLTLGQNLRMPVMT